MRRDPYVKTDSQLKGACVYWQLNNKGVRLEEIAFSIDIHSPFERYSV